MGRTTTGKYVVPPEIRALKPRNIPCTVKKTKGHYYVYTLKEVPDERNVGKTKFTTDKLIGKIENNRYIPNSDASRKMKKQCYTTKNYGEYAIALNCSMDVLDKLESVFSIEEAEQIYTLSIIHFVEGFTPASYIKEIYDQSILSIKWPNISISENSVHFLLKQLGLHNLLTEKFQQKLVDESSGLTALDGHVILSCSNESDLANFGNKYQKYGNKQINIMMAYDIDNNSPLTCRAFDGAVPDKVEVQEWFETYHFRDGTTFVVDMGFYSEENLSLYRSNNSFFVIPVPDNTIISKMMKQSYSLKSCFQYEKKGENGKQVSDTVFYRESSVSELEAMAQEQEDQKAEEDYKKRITEYEQLLDKKNKRKPRRRKAKQVVHSAFSSDRIIMYRNETMHSKLAAEYYSQIGQDDKHTEEKYRELEPTFGLIILRTNSNSTPKEEYCKYKKRWHIETNYNHVRNDVDFNSFQLENYYTTQGLSFLILIEDLIYRRFMRTLRAAPSKNVNHMSKRECLCKARHVKVLLHSDGKWHSNKFPSHILDMISEMGANLDEDLAKMDSNTY